MKALATLVLATLASAAVAQSSLPACDQQADDVEILGTFKNWLPLKSREGQTDVYVFYSGHGLPSDDGASLYLLPHGVDRQFLDRTAIKQWELVSALQAVSPKSVTLFMDACYSGADPYGRNALGQRTTDRDPAQGLGLSCQLHRH